MLTFIVSMRARPLSGNWAYHCWLLDCTLASILAQNNPAFTVVVVCHERPEVSQAHHPSLHFLEVAFAPPERTNDAMCGDKVRKLARGVAWAQARGSEYVMFVDADDLVSRRLAEYAASHPGENGWFFDQGYVLRSGASWLQRHQPHHLICGTGVIVATRTIGPAQLGDDIDALVEQFDHHTLASRLQQQGWPLRPLPFSGAIYVLHPDSTSEVPGGSGYRGAAPDDRPLWRRSLGALKHFGRTLPSMRPITPRLRTEFTIPATGFRHDA